MDWNPPACAAAILSLGIFATLPPMAPPPLEPVKGRPWASTSVPCSACSAIICSSISSRPTSRAIPPPRAGPVGGNADAPRLPFPQGQLLLLELQRRVAQLKLHLNGVVTFDV